MVSMPYAISVANASGSSSAGKSTSPPRPVEKLSESEDGKAYSKQLGKGLNAYSYEVFKHKFRNGGKIDPEALKQIRSRTMGDADKTMNNILSGKPGKPEKDAKDNKLGAKPRTAPAPAKPQTESGRVPVSARTALKRSDDIGEVKSGAADSVEFSKGGAKNAGSVSFSAGGGAKPAAGAPGEGAGGADSVSFGTKPAGLSGVPEAKPGAQPPAAKH